jgi:hypothetical protein
MFNEAVPTSADPDYGAVDYSTNPHDDKSPNEDKAGERDPRATGNEYTGHDARTGSGPGVTEGP